MGTKNPKEQCFMHIATYRLTDLRTAEIAVANLGPDVLEPTITDTLASALTERLTATCEQHEWQVVDIHAFADRVEILVSGVEAAGETGEAVAKALDGAVYSGAGTEAGGELMSCV